MKEVDFILCFVNYFEQVYFVKINDLLFSFPLCSSLFCL